MAMELEEWQALVGRPEWRKFEQYLKDYRSQLMEHMASGGFTSSDPGEAVILYNNGVSQCQIYQDLIELKFKTISNFYHKPEDSYEEESKDDDNS